MMALKLAGVERVLAVSAVGTVNGEIPVGGLSLLSQFVDFTRRRTCSYGKYSVNMTDPFCGDLRNHFIQAAERKGIPLRPEATLACVDGPIYETRKELRLYRS